MLAFLVAMSHSGTIKIKFSTAINKGDCDNGYKYQYKWEEMQMCLHNKSFVNEFSWESFNFLIRIFKETSNPFDSKFLKKTIFNHKVCLHSLTKQHIIPRKGDKNKTMDEFLIEPNETSL